MRWSYSASRTFRQCQRSWYFKNAMASARANDAHRRRAYRLSKLRTLSAWRGQIVDDAISTLIVPALNRRRTVTLRDVKNWARERFDRQLAFALKHPINDPDLDVSAAGDAFTLFFEMEYGVTPTAEDIGKAWSEIESALTNLYAMDEVKSALKSADYVIAQRRLQYGLMDGINVAASPDAIAFRPNAAPAIIDWKVHVFGQNDAWLQLAIYALALSRAKHRDFPAHAACEPKDVVLLEAQLLTGSLREHRVEQDQIDEAEEYIIASACEISALVDGRKYPELKPDEFRAAAYAETCQRCSFRSICWEGSNVH
jgi:hypothetical protein